jgi:hypothetical protein
VHTASNIYQLPREIRYMIWTCVFVEAPSGENTTVTVRTDKVSSARLIGHPVRPFTVDFEYKNLSILATCRSVYDEAKPVFWAKSTFLFERTADLNHFLKQRTILPGPRLFTNLANVQHVRLLNDDINNVQHVFRDRVLARLANGDNIVSLVMQHDDKWPCWCERCLDVQEVFDVEWDERQAERVAEDERIQGLEEKHEGGLEQILAENKEAIRDYEHLFTED